MTLSEQAMSCIMLALQKSLMEQTDIVPLLKSFKFNLEDEKLFVSNPPTSMKLSNEDAEVFLRTQEEN